MFLLSVFMNIVKNYLPGTFSKLSKSKFSYFYKFLISFVVDNILLKIKTLIAKINRSNPLFMYVNKKKSEFIMTLKSDGTQLTLYAY